jgi:hypothetical protein
MKSVIYQEVQGDTTYKLLGREVGNVIIYDIELETTTPYEHNIETVSAISTDCQTSMLLLELIIRKEVRLCELIKRVPIRG